MPEVTFPRDSLVMGDLEHPWEPSKGPGEVLIGIPGIQCISGAMDSDPSSHVPAIYVAKYNRFVDNILGRINKILRTNYDPVTVKLTNPNASTKSGKGKGKNKKSKNKAKRKSSSVGSEKSATGVAEANGKPSQSALKAVDTATSPLATTLIPDNEATTPMTLELTTYSDLAETISPTQSNSESSMSRGTNTSSKKDSKKSSGNKNRTKTKSTNKTKTSNNKKKSKKNNKPKAKATLYGLASLQRSGDVSVNMMSDHTTIKTKFSLGPLVLKVEKEFGRAAKKELRSATATTAEMSGKLSLRVLHGGAATLHSIRVLQPKQVRVESADDHDRTREFVWKRSSHIAHLVSQKLSTATRSMLRPPPVPVERA